MKEDTLRRKVRAGGGDSKRGDTARRGGGKKPTNPNRVIENPAHQHDDVTPSCRREKEGSFVKGEKRSVNSEVTIKWRGKKKRGKKEKKRELTRSGSMLGCT